MISTHGIILEIPFFFTRLNLKCKDLNLYKVVAWIDIEQIATE